MKPLYDKTIIYVWVKKALILNGNKMVETKVVLLFIVNNLIMMMIDISSITRIRDFYCKSLCAFILLHISGIIDVILYIY